MSTRSKKIIMTNEARVLRALRLEYKLSMKQAADRAGISDSLIAHIETGRTNVPKGDKLVRLLVVYGGIKLKSFSERARRFQDTTSPKDEAYELLKRMTEKQAHILLPVMKAISTT